MPDAHFRALRGPAEKVAVYIGPSGELVVDTTTWQISVQDGVTAGGVYMAVDALATTAMRGLMSPYDKMKLDSMVVGAAVSGVKGNAETDYRTGDVNLTPAQIGASPVGHTHDAGDIATGMISAANIPPLDASKITTGTLSSALIPDLDASKITGGVFPAERIPNLSASKITSGTLDPERVPDLGADKITSGVFSADRIPEISAAKITSGVLSSSQIPSLDASKIASGTLDAKRIPDLDASKIATGTLDTDRIPSLDASKVTTGTFNAARIPSLDASKIATGTLDTKRIPDLDASKIATGTLDVERIPELDASQITTGVFTAAQIPSLDASKIATGTLGADRIPSLDASKITTGTLNAARIPSLDASKITTGTLNAARIPNLDASKITTGTLPVSRGGTGQTTVANIQAGKDAAGNTITATYATKTELSNLQKGLVQNVTALPSTGAEGIIYLVPNATDSSTSDKYVWENNAWQFLGNTSFSLDDYVTKDKTITGLSVSGRTITYTKGDGTTGTITTQDNNTTYSAGTGLALSGTTFSVSSTAGTSALAWNTEVTLGTVGGLAIKAKLPANPNTNTDTLVNQNVSSTDATYPILLCPTANATANQGAKTAIFGSGVKVNPKTGTITATTFSGAFSGNATTATTATKATQDSAGQQITTTYIKGLSVSGKTITYTKGDGTTGTITTQDTNTTYTAGTGLALSGTTFSVSSTAGTSALAWNTEVTLGTVGGLAIKAKLPANPNTNTDTLVNQNVSSTDATYPILLCPTANATANQGAKTAIFGSGVKVNPKTGTITATTFSGAFSGNATTATKATQDSAGQQINTTYIKGLSVSGRTITYTKGDGTTGTITTQDNNTTYTAGTGLALSGTTFSVSSTAGTSALAWNSEVTLGTVGGLAIKAKLPANPNTNTTYSAGYNLQLSGTTFNVKSCLVGQSGSTSTKPWYKFASAVGNVANDDLLITFLVEKTYSNRTYGILRAHVRINGDKKYDACNFTWLSDTGMDASYFMLVAGTAASPTIELWVKIPEAYTFYRFTVLSEGKRTTSVNNVWTLYNAASAGQADNPTTGTQVLSSRTALALKATQDSAGQQINTTYIKGLSVSGRTITYTKGDGTTGTITTQDNNTTYSAGTGLALSGTTFSVSSTAGTSTLAWNSEVTLGTVGGLAIKAKLPANPNTNTDTLVTQNVSSTNATYPILLCPTANATANQGAKTAIFGSGIKVNPNTSTITATTFSGNATSATKATQDGSGNTITSTYLPLSGGTVTGTLILSRSTDAAAASDNKPALIVGSTSTGLHLELDGNEIMCKSNGTTASILYLNNDGGEVHIGTGGLSVAGTAQVTKSITTYGTFDARHSTAIRGTAPSANVWRQNAFYDKNGINFGGVEHGYLTTLQNRINLIVYKGTSATDNTNAQIAVGFDADGNWFTYAPTPAATSNTSYIATTAWVRTYCDTTKKYLTSHQSLSNYVTLNGTQTITGAKTFSTTINVIGEVSIKDTTSTEEGGQISLHAPTKGTTYAGTVIDNYRGYLRIFGIASADGKTKTGTGTSLNIDPYAKTITGGYTFTGALNGNANSATKLATARKINNVSFDGTADVTVDSVNGNFNLINTSVSARGTAPSAWTCRDLRFLDNSTNAYERRTLGWVRCAYNASNQCAIELKAFRPDASVDNALGLIIQYNSATDNYAKFDVAKVVAPTPADNNNSTEVATTAWVQKFCGTTKKYTSTTYNASSWANMFGANVALSNGTINVANGSTFTYTVSANITFTFSGVPSGRAATFTLVLTNGGSKVVTWPSSVKWTGGSVPSLSTSGVDVLTFLTPNGGTTWYGVISLLTAS